MKSIPALPKNVFFNIIISALNNKKSRTRVLRVKIMNRPFLKYLSVSVACQHSKETTLGF